MSHLNAGRDKSCLTPGRGRFLRREHSLISKPIAPGCAHPGRLPRPASQTREVHSGTSFFLPLFWLGGPPLPTLHTSPSHLAFAFRDHPASVTFLELTVALSEMETGLLAHLLAPHRPHLQHRGSWLTDWLEFESQKRLCPTATCPAPKPTWSTRHGDVMSSDCCHSFAGLSGGPTHSPPPCGLPGANPRRRAWLRS